MGKINPTRTGTLLKRIQSDILGTIEVYYDGTMDMNMDSHVSLYFESIYTKLSAKYHTLSLRDDPQEGGVWVFNGAPTGIRTRGTYVRACMLGHYWFRIRHLVGVIDNIERDWFTACAVLDTRVTANVVMEKVREAEASEVERFLASIS